MAEYMDLVVFLEGRDGKKKPRTVGYLKIDGLAPGALANAKVYGQVDVLPTSWDGSFKVEPKREQDAPRSNGAAVGASYRKNDRPDF